MHAFELRQAERITTITLGLGRHLAGGGEDALRIEGLAPGALQLDIALDGVYVEAQVEGARLAGRPLEPRERWLWRPGALLEVENAAIALLPPPRRAEATAALAGALLNLGAASSGPALRWLNGPDCGKRVAVPEGQPLLVGRGEEVGARVRDAQASRRHARLRLDGEGARISDLGSRNGLWVNGRRVARERRLAGGDQVRVGETWLAFEKPEEAVAGVGSSAPAPARRPARARLAERGRTLLEVAALGGAALAGALGTGALWLLGR